MSPSLAALRALRFMFPSDRDTKGSVGFRVSISRVLVGLAVGRLPSAMSVAERDRWAEEMSADLAEAGGCFRRFLFAVRLWRKGAPSMPVGVETAARSTENQASDEVVDARTARLEEFYRELSEAPPEPLSEWAP